jgi:hypothetical protein
MAAGENPDDTHSYQMRYSKENYERAQSELEKAQGRDAERLRQREQASEFEKLPDITYQHVTDVIEYLSGKSVEQANKKLSELHDQAQDEALELKRRHELLTGTVVQARSSFAQSVDQLKRFEAELLGK